MIRVCGEGRGDVLFVFFHYCLFAITLIKGFIPLNSSLPGGRGEHFQHPDPLL